MDAKTYAEIRKRKMAAVRLVVYLDDEQLAKVEREAKEAGWTKTQWIEWLVSDYQSPESLAPTEAP